MLYPEHKELLKDKMGRYRTKSLFRETAYGTSNLGAGLPPLWTLRPEDPQGELPSLKQLYLECNDPTEYKVAMQAFGSWDHWRKLKELTWFKEYVDQWMIELEIKMRSDAIESIVQEAQAGKTRVNAAKYIANGDYKGSKRGRPSKEEIDRERKIQAGIRSEFDEDFNRIHESEEVH